MKKLVEGTIKRHPDGFGFLIPDEKELPDVYIPRHSMQGIMTNDRVVANVQESKEKKNRYFGEIVKFIERQTKRVYGQYANMSSQYGLVVDNEGSWGSDIYILKSQNMGANEGQMVAVEIFKEPTNSGHLAGKVIEILGDMKDPLTDLKRVVINNQLPLEFDKEVRAEAAYIPTEVTAKDHVGRKNLTHLPFVTIDGITAKDFDDAIFVKTAPTGFQLWVAIADVSHYVKRGTAIDDEAYHRGTSTYFPKYVIPMLPEALSNEICSLKPNVERLSLVCEMHFDFKGETTQYQIYEAVIKSQARVTYGVAQEIVDGVCPPEMKHVEENILRSADLAKILMAKRFREGSLDLEIPESQIILDDLGNPIDIIKAERVFSHRLIEEMMLIANVCVAKFLNDKGSECLYRIHEPPLPEDIEVLEKFVYNFGEKKIGGGKLQKRLTRILEAFSGRAEGEALSMLILRSMSQAKYSPENLGHFGLAFSHYAHFTSPIRRYPDLIVHRLLKHFVVNQIDYPNQDFDTLATAGTWLSACEQKSVKAERQFKSIKAARFMQNFLGQEFVSVISSVGKMGVFVLLRQYDVTGLIKMENLGTKGLEYDEENLRLVSPKTGIIYKVGDTLTVTVSRADIEEGKIDFLIAGDKKVADSIDRQKDWKNDKKRRPSKDNRRRSGKARVSKSRRKGKAR